MVNDDIINKKHGDNNYCTSNVKNNNSSDDPGEVWMITQARIIVAKYSPPVNLISRFDKTFHFLYSASLEFTTFRSINKLVAATHYLGVVFSLFRCTQAI